MKVPAAMLATLVAGCAPRVLAPSLTTHPAPTLRPGDARAVRLGATSETLTVNPAGEVAYRGRLVARITARALLELTGATRATLDDQGGIEVRGSRRRLRLAQASLLRDDGLRLACTDDGRVVLRDPSGTEISTPWQMLPAATPEATAAALLALAIVDGPETAPEPLP